MKYFLRKTLPIIFMPLNLAIIFVFLYLLLNVKYLLYISILILYIFSSGIASSLLWKFIEYPWERFSVNQIEKADAIVVLSSSISFAKGKDNIVEWGNYNRFIAGIELLKNNKSNLLIFTGGSDKYSRSLPLIGSFYKEQAISLDVPAEKIITTQSVINTFEEVSEVARLLESSDFPDRPHILLVTDAFHMHRSLMLFGRHEIVVTPYPVGFKSGYQYRPHNLANPLFWLPNASCLNLSSIALREILGRLKYCIFP